MTMISIIGLSEKRNLKQLLITVLILEMTMVGVFLALDAIVFYLFWELSLVPMLYIIGAWGGNLRIYAAVKFFLYTFYRFFNYACRNAIFRICLFSNNRKLEF